MGADNQAVVDSQARVRAVGRLRIVDASIMPRVITSNLNVRVAWTVDAASWERDAVLTTGAAS
jgi:choline dehydrogenase